MTVRHDDSFAGATVIGDSHEKRSMQVLVVDDTRQVREFITRLLRSAGFQVLEAEDGLAAQRILGTEHPSLVITDLEMPICDGWSVLMYCRARHPYIPVLLMSGGALGRHPDIECWAAGSLSKPFGISCLRTEVERLVCRAA